MLTIPEFAHNASSLTIFDAYPKATFHFLLLPRILSSVGEGADAIVEVEGTTSVQPLKAAQLSNLQSLLKVDKARAKDLILGLHRDAQEVRRLIEEEMMNRYGFKWDIYTGFHAVPSMEYVHLTCHKLLLLRCCALQAPSFTHIFQRLVLAIPEEQEAL